MVAMPATVRSRANEDLRLRAQRRRLGSAVSSGESREDIVGPERLELPQKMLVAAIALMPLQSALTYDAGFPLKPSEILVILAGALLLLNGRMFSGPRRLVSTEKLVVPFFVVVIASALATFARQPPTGPLHGFTRSPTTDAALYTFYGALVVVMWWMFRQLPRDLMVKAVIFSIWLAAVMCAIQIVLTASDASSLLAKLGYHSVPPGHPLPGIGIQLPRNGSFVEGQHLGFFCGVAFFIALLEKRRWAAVACLAMLVVSQSTTGFLAVALGYAVAVLIRPTASSVVRFGGAAVVAACAVFAVPALRTAAQIQLGKLGLVHTGIDYLTKSISLRTVKTNIGLDIMWDHPLLGVGPGRYGVAFYDYVKPGQVTPSYFQPDFRALAENVYAQIGAEFGVVALLAFGLFVVGYIFRVAKHGAIAVAAAVALVLGLSTQSDWTFLPAWTFLAYLAVVALHPHRVGIRAGD